MSLKSKAKAQKQREHNKRLHEQELQKTQSNALRLRAMTSGFARTERRAQDEQAFRESKTPTYAFERRVTVVHDKPLDERFTARSSEVRQLLSPEMAAREAAAVERYEEMKKMVQPLYNKGGLQYPDAGAVEAAKKGELRRRS